MPRMLGRYCSGGCACRDCGAGRPDTRWRKRVEARDLASDDLTEHLRPGVGLGPLYDLSDCQHGCSGSPCNSDRCTFICHDN